MKNLNRRDFIKTIGMAGSLVILPKFIISCTNNYNRPNILFIMVDDLGKEWISAYGAYDVNTPNIDALAKEGMMFKNAYSMPQCTPSRVTLLTGKYPWRSGWVNHWDVPRWGVGYFDWKKKANMTFARILKKAGYKTAAAGKWQINDFRIEPRAMEKHGFDDWCVWTGYETQNPPSGNRYQNPYINTPEGSKTYKDKYGPDVYTDYLIDFMKKNKDDPMMIYYPMALTHGPLHNTPDNPDADDVLSKFKGMVKYTDKLVGKLIKALTDLGIRENTIVVFTTDNGSPGSITANRNTIKILGGKATKTENGVCEPFIVNCPGFVPSGVETDALTDFTDLLPTFADLAGAQIPSGFDIDGVSIAPVLLGTTDDSPRKWIMALGHGPATLDEKGVRGKTDFASRVIRDKEYKVWIDENKSITRLHDLKNDPFEENNLIKSSTPSNLQAINKFQAVVDSLPDKDARPIYEPREPRPWDLKMGEI